MSPPQNKPKSGRSGRSSALDVVEGIPDRSALRPAWKYLLLAVLFVCWMAFLIYCAMA